ncbi:MAG: hypothetical protein EP329_28675 [Deltaproteobacteria bacterium]|nr:MAG: hypothetical protein EP329_28675 [Deltaproteobacteria bacterium]
MAPRRWAVPVVLGALVALAACEQAPGEPFDYPDFAVTRLVPTGWMTGTRVEITAEGLLPTAVATYTLDVEVGDETLSFPLAIDADQLVAEVGADWFSAVEPPPSELPAVAVVHRRVGEREDVSVAFPVVLGHWPYPTFDGFGVPSPIEVYPGDPVPIVADELFRPEEGAAGLVVVGSRTYTDGGGASERYEGDALLDVGGASGRAAEAVVVVPELIGLRPGRFDGVAAAANEDDAPDFAAWSFTSETVPIVFDVLPPRLDAVAPTTTSRGRWLEVRGRGFLPLDAAAETASVLVFDGVFTPRRGDAEDHTGGDAWVVPVEEVDGNTVGRAPLRTQVSDAGGLVGLGARAGRFEGTVTLRVAAGADVVTSDALPIALDVTTPRQEVELRVLPGFDDALALFGLEAERDAVLARVLAVVERDYAGLSIGFAYAAPEGYAEWSVVELAGEDPNGAGLLGLDATAGKDVGNLRLDDVIGGFDPETRARGFAAYGGVFASELLNLSPTIGTNVLVSSRFDDVFAEVVPALGGIPAEPGESAAADARGAAIREAVRVFGNLVGSTITHEVGHTLGLAALDGRVHNDGDNPGWIMDLGIHRPFEERAELDGAGPGVFSPVNRAYLEQILPPAATE